MGKGFLYSLRVLHGRFYEWRINVWPWVKKRINNPFSIFLVLTPEHGNLGDHAIAQAEKEFLAELGISYIEITGKRLEELQQKKLLHVMNGRPIFINGGGSLGTLWFRVEQLTRNIVLDNPKSPIILFPSTIYYENTEWGKEEEEKSVAIYNSHPKCLFFARERVSFEIMSKLYNNVSITPDMVLRLNRSNLGTSRNGCILCLRKDREKTRSDSIETKIRAVAKAYYGDNVIDRDMIVDHQIPVLQRDQELEQQYEAFRQAELVITDRLHGMIFAAITGTPCIVIDSKSPKIRGCYQWIKELGYIKFCEDPNKIEEVFQLLPKEGQQYPVDALSSLYDPLKIAVIKATKMSKKHAKN